LSRPGAGVVYSCRRLSLEVVRLLLQSGAPPEALSELLSEAVKKRVPLSEAIAELRPEFLPLLEREAAREGLSTLELVRPDPQLVMALPEGLCERLGVLPLLRDARTGQVEAAALDPFDSHALAELAHHLETGVHVRLASLEAFRAGLARLRARTTPGATDTRSPVPRPVAESEPAKAPARPPSEAPSQPPLPLVRRAPESRLSNPVPPAGRTLAMDDGEPVLSLARAKPSGVRAVPAPEPFLDFEQAIREIDEEKGPDGVVTALARCMEPAPAVVLAVRGGGYEGRAANRAFGGDDAVKRFRLPAGFATAVEAAIDAGYFLGVLPTTPAHAPFRELLGRYAGAELYLTPVGISGRPSLILCTVVDRPTLEITRRANDLSRAAGLILERILVNKKRGAGR
jgi:hypothetical protein